MFQVFSIGSNPDPVQHDLKFIEPFLFKSRNYYSIFYNLHN